MRESIAYNFLKSALAVDNLEFSLEDILSWLDIRKKKIQHKVTEINFSEMQDWFFDDQSGNLTHNSRKFFSIEGIRIATNWGNVSEWTQPVINQPEIGFLGIIAQKRNGVLHFLMQAKVEPGNINSVQLSPTLQATKSNYLKIHKGNAPRYLEYFIENRSDVSVLLDQLQSEQGARFLKKRNRNIIIEIHNDIKLHEDFCWLTLGQIKQLLSYDNIVNMDTRTVISCISYGNLDTFSRIKDYNNSNTYLNDLLISEISSKEALNSIESIISWITKHKSFAELEVDKIPLKDVEKWHKDDYSIYHNDRKYFSVIAVKAEIGNREVKSWTQPLLKSAQEGIIAFIIKKINGVYHFLVQAKLESGNFDIIELAPTVQCLTGNYRKGESEYEVEFLDYVLNPKENNALVRYSTFQSEEGGRFYREQNKNMIVEVSEDFDINVSDKYIWMTLNQMKTFIQFNNYLNIQSRSLLSTIKFI